MTIPTPNLTNPNTYAQALVLLVSGSAVYFQGCGRRRLGFFLNIIIAPVWWFSNAYAAQFGMLILSFWHTANTVRAYQRYRSESW